MGATLLSRSTRRVSPTEIGLAYYERARRVLNDAVEADALVSSTQSEPVGPLRISVAADFGVHCLSPLVGNFLHEHPDITLDIVLNNRRVDLVSERFDVAVRIGDVEDASLGARKLFETENRLIASPSYFQKFGRPMTIDDLNKHALLHVSDNATPGVWKLRTRAGEVRNFQSTGSLTVNDGQSLLNAVIAGHGIAYLPSFLFGDALAQGLVDLALPTLPADTQGIYAVYPRGRLSQPKVRALVDFLSDAFAAGGRGNAEFRVSA